MLLSTLLGLLATSSFISTLALQDQDFNSSYPPLPKVTTEYHSKVEKVKWVDCSTHAPASVAAAANFTGTNWPIKKLGPLPEFLQCGRLDVPMDYQKPLRDDNKITIAFARVASNVTTSKGLLFWNPGGPGSEAQSLAWGQAFARGKSKNGQGQPVLAGLEDFDFVALDPRGTGDSNQLKCDFDILSDPPLGTLQNEADFNKFVDLYKRYGESCVKQSKPKGIVGFVGTEDSVNDYESLGIALGFEKVSWLGVSYGTYFGAEYAYQFPQRVDRFVLDAVAAHGLPDVDKVQMDVHTANDLLQRADAWCLAASECPFHKDGNGTIPSVFKNASSLASPEDFDTLRFIFASLTTGQVQFAAFADNLDQFYQGLKSNSTQHKRVRRSDAPPTQEELVGLLLPATRCKDQPPEDPTYEGFRKIMETVTGEDPNQFAAFSGNWMNLISCAAWPIPGRPNARIPSDVALMLVTSDFDKNTPTEMATFTRDDFPNAVLVVRNGDDHGSISEIGSLAAALERDFLITGQLPNSTDLELVDVIVPGQQRPPIPDPYQVPVGLLAGDADAVDSDNANTTKTEQSSKAAINEDVEPDSNALVNHEGSGKGWWKDLSKLRVAVIALAIAGGTLLLALLATLTFTCIYVRRKRVTKHNRHESELGAQSRTMKSSSSSPSQGFKSGWGGDGMKGRYDAVAKGDDEKWTEGSAKDYYDSTVTEEEEAGRSLIASKQ